jgi:hypothetical protein
VERRADRARKAAVTITQSRRDRVRREYNSSRRILMKRALLAVTIVAAAGALALGQPRQPSPVGTAATEVGGKYNNAAEPEYIGGKWIEITYGRPIRRGRDLWGAGPNYGEMVKAGAPVWRAGANVSTRLKTDVPLAINNKTVAPGEYSLFIDLKPGNWTFIVSSWPAQTTYNPSNRDALWGAFGYTSAKDVVRAPMTLANLPYSVDELTWSFVDVTDSGGKMAVMWDKQMASVPFRLSR